MLYVCLHQVQQRLIVIARTAATPPQYNKSTSGYQRVRRVPCRQGPAYLRVYHVSRTRSGRPETNRSGVLGIYHRLRSWTLTQPARLAQDAPP